MYNFSETELRHFVELLVTGEFKDNKLAILLACREPFLFTTLSKQSKEVPMVDPYEPEEFDPYRTIIKLVLAGEHGPAYHFSRNQFGISDTDAKWLILCFRNSLGRHHPQHAEYPGPAPSVLLADYYYELERVYKNRVSKEWKS